MLKMPAMDAVVSILIDEGVETVFGIPGAAILPLYQSLSKVSDRIRSVTARHEEGATHMADGWARITGRVGVAIGTSGPAGTNMVTGVYTAWADSIPMITITGQVPRSQLHREGFQAVDIVNIVKPVVKKSFLVMEPAQIPWVFREAFRIAREGRPGPVHIDLPLDVQKAEILYDPSIDQSLPVFRTPPNPAAIRRAVDLLLQARRPLILAGGGVITAKAENLLRQLAEYLQIPVSPTLMAWGVIPADHPLAVGTVGIQTHTRSANRVFLESDLVLAVGARFAERHTGDLAIYTRDRQFIQIDVDPGQIGRIIEPTLGIVSDAKLALEALLTEVRDRVSPQSPSDWVDRVQVLRDSYDRVMDIETVPIHPARVFKAINLSFGPDTVFTTAIGLYQIWSGQFQRVYRPRHYLVCGQAGPLGWEIPAAIGVKLARPQQEVVAVVGDYSFEFLVEEIAVAVQYRIPFVMVMLNNGYLGLIRQPSKYQYQMNYGVDISYDHNDGMGMDNVAMVEAMGGLGRRVTAPHELEPALAWARREAEAHRLPVLVEVFIQREADAAMGPALDQIREFGPVIDREPELLTPQKE
ncbi:glyoxylate carboligase [Sulfobacillus thermosulfidooxidans]|uniref:glyoxylate carboligase n=1 Tax=Sulfobacillus thermosulfidooxidans TaxID=28034 RepID=UPI00096B85A3|nr:glyoxylate carboligase [Sulfobacillus thermosulfidooxidans]OLZ08758.1 glyoxylate carboligase [Sulfobacillus thermosulfidooxidans]OLZ14822.1 glyoxylate carboligase [Sulfobacillus thermosulfidooxidans]OLZ22034.1 glyoxylate carboligase [Sulfobacillus thermosulfidooxidans]